ncbi:MAG: hypothetical protein WAK17_19625 [Candidatus Nitrosopolaris sp.]
MNCHIYIGIFKKKYSSATAEEYKLAAENNKEILAYVADVKRRDPELNRLLQKIRERHKYKPYENIKKLRGYAKDDLHDLRNRCFLEAKSVKRSPFGNIVSVEANTELADEIFMNQ